MQDMPGGFESLMERLRQGDERAARELLEIYGPHIVRAVRHRIHRSLRSSFDSIDFEQAVWASFFSGGTAIHRCDTPESLLAFLVEMACHKVSNELRARYGTQKREKTRETCSLEEISRAQGPPRDARQASPSQIAVANECWHRLLDGEPSHHREIVRLRYLGLTNRQVAASVGVNERTVRRVLAKLARRIE